MSDFKNADNNILEGQAKENTEIEPQTVLAEQNELYSEKLRKKNKGMSNFCKALIVLCVISIFGGGALGIGIGFGGKLADNFWRTKSSDEHFVMPESSQTSNDTNNENASTSNSLADKIDYVKSSVVSIHTVSTASNAFFGQSYQQSGSGSGVIFYKDDEKVYIVTNCHVISGANKVTITVGDSEEVNAHLVGKVEEKDLAVIYVTLSDLNKIGIVDLVMADFGDSDKVRVLDTVVAVGNALGEGDTVTKGVVSAKDKEVDIDGKTLNVIQIDASINPGNSGGALFNSNGEVIGINTAKVSTYIADNIGYSIPSNIVKSTIEDIMNQKLKPQLGVVGFDLTKELAKAYNAMPGFLVDSVVAGSAADSAGIARGDIITGFNGNTIMNFEMLAKEIEKCEIGDEVEIHFLRNGYEPMSAKVILNAAANEDF